MKPAAAKARATHGEIEGPESTLFMSSCVRVHLAGIVILLTYIKTVLYNITLNTLARVIMDI